MRPRRLFGLPLAVLLAAASFPAGTASAQTPEPVGATAGQVVESSTSRGITGAFLRAFGPDGRVVGRGFSGQDGFFTVPLPAGGPYRLEVESMGFRLAVVDSLRIPASDTVRLAPIPLVPDSVSGPVGLGPLAPSGHRLAWTAGFLHRLRSERDDPAVLPTRASR